MRAGPVPRLQANQVCVFSRTNQAAHHARERCRKHTREPSREHPKEPTRAHQGAPQRTTQGAHRGEHKITLERSPLALQVCESLVRLKHGSRRLLFRIPKGQHRRAWQVAILQSNQVCVISRPDKAAHQVRERDRTRTREPSRKHNNEPIRAHQRAPQIG